MVDLRSRLAAALADRYAIEREIGSGGTALVYLARDLKHSRLVAVKVLRPELGASLSAERFLREIRIAAGLTHPHILAVHDSGEVNGLLYYVMPYVEGESLRDRLKREGPLPVDDALRVAHEVADALAYAHSQGVVHRDIKPGNILLVGGHAVVADFGIAMAAGTETDALTELGLAIGTPAYMSPEQGGSAGPVDGRTDLYSLGCVLYEMLTGVPPFSGSSPQAVLARHASDPPAPVRAARPSVPVAVDAAVIRALAKLPADRFPTAQQFADALDGARPRPAAARRSTRPDARLAAYAAAAVLVVAVAAAALALARRQPARSAPRRVTVVILPAPSPGGSSPAARTTYGALAGALEWLPGVRALDGALLPAVAASADAAVTPAVLANARRIGGQYVLASSVLPGDTGGEVSLDLYTTESGERVGRSQAAYSGRDPFVALPRAAMGVVRALAEREGMARGARAQLLNATGSSVALGDLVEGQSRFFQGDFDGAADALAAAVQADSQCALARFRLSVAHVWRHDYAAALASVEAGLRLQPKPAPRWLSLLDAQRLYVLHEGDSAIAAFQRTVVDDPGNIDGWLGLGESLFHFAATTGHRPQEGRPAFERVVALDSMFAPIQSHLVDIALRDGDLAMAERWLRAMRPDDPSRVARAAAIELRRATGADRARVLASLAGAERYAISELVALLAHDSTQLAVADTVAQFLLAPDRTRDDRRRGAQYRLAILAAQNRWPDALAAWRRGGGPDAFDAWITLAGLAGFPADSLRQAMLDRARAAMAAGHAPNFALPVIHEYQQGVQALVAQATLAGDSAEVLGLLRTLREAPPPTDPTDALRELLTASLEARLALLAADTARAMTLLHRSVVRRPELSVTFFPFLGMAPQRFLLARLAAQRRDPATARQWLASFADGWAIPDIIYGPSVRRLTIQLNR